MHPDIDTLRNFFKTHPSLDREKRYAAAVSGGPDSMALAHTLIHATAQQGKELFLITVDHGLREEAKDEAQMVADWVAEQNAPHVSHVILKWGEKKPLSGVMEVARKVRYEMMAEYCASKAALTLFVAHHQDDQAETFLIRLSKGSGLDGLASMAVVRHYNEDLKIIRPFLKASKEELINYCDKYNVPYAVDPSNKNKDYLRPRLRESMAALEAEGLSNKRLATTAQRMGRAREALETITAHVFHDCFIQKTNKAISFDFDHLKEQPEEIGLRVIHRALEEMRGDTDYNVRMEKLEDLFQSIWFESKDFKPRTLGGAVFSLKRDKSTGNTALYIEKEA